MALLNHKKIKEMFKEQNKQVSAEFMTLLEGKVKQTILRSIHNAHHFKRVTAVELIHAGDISVDGE